MRGLTRCTYLRLGHRHGEADAGTLIAHLRDTVPRLAPVTATTVPGDEPARGSRHQLPADTGAFTGREPELARLQELADASLTSAGAGTVVIFAIDGMGGVGKTALAIHAGHHMGHRFPDGVLFVELNGYALDTPPRDPADALASVLISLGVPPQRIPDDVSGRAAAYRDWLADKRMLIILDNAVNEQQVGPLLPGSPGCLVLITSRRRLNALDDAYALPLDVLPLPEAIALLRATATAQRAPVDDALVAQIATLCGRLPLALRIAGAMLRTGRAHTPTHLADLLRAPHPGTAQLVDLTGFHDGGRNLLAVIARSYHTLDPEQRLLYRRLGLIPGPDTDLYAVAALLDTDPAAAERLLADLVDHNLLTQPAPGRYQLHDLIRAHTRTLTETDPADQRDAAIDRLLGYYQHTANTADTLTSNITRHPPEGPAHTYAPALPDPEAAWAWLRTERPNLLAALDHATASGHRPAHALALAAGLATLLRIDGPYDQALTLYTATATAAHHQGDHRAQATALTHRGWTRTLAGDHPGAINDLQQAHRLYQNTGDRLGQANTLTYLGQTRRQTGDYLGATRDLREALGLYRDLGDRLGQALALSYLGRTRLQTNDVPGATRDLHEALRLCRDSGNRIDQGNALTYLGQTRLAAGEPANAAHNLQQALDLYRQIGARANEAFALPHYAAAIAATGDHTRALNLYHQALTLTRQLHQPNDQALALEGIGTCHLNLGDTTTGTDHLTQALAIFQRLGMSADAHRIQTRLTELNKP
jgi:tetratricopeptide (TPR) repeat protein